MSLLLLLHQRSLSSINHETSRSFFEVGQRVGGFLRQTIGYGIVFLGNVLLFLMAYVPLILMFAAIIFPDSLLWSSILVLSAIGISVIGYVSVLSSVNGRSSQKGHVLTVQNDGRGSMAYLATYILPFLSGVPDAPEKWVAAGVYVVTLFGVFSQTDVRSVNPTLFLLGMKVAKVKLTDSRVEFEAICLSNIKEKDQVTVSSFGGATVVDLSKYVMSQEIGDSSTSGHR